MLVITVSLLVQGQEGGAYGVAIGKESLADLGSIAMGNETKAGENAVAVGGSSVASEWGSTALGPAAQATVEGGTAIGRSSIADREGGQKWTTPFTETDGPVEAWQSAKGYGAVSVGGNKSVYESNRPITRQIINVAAGTEDTDVVNVAQLKNLKKYGDETYATKKDFKVMDERVGVLENGMEALKDGFTIRPKNGYQEIRVRQGDVTMGGNRIQGVGDAVAATDAVNKRQLDNTARSLHKKINDVDKDMKAGVAMALAVAGLPQAYIPGKSMLAMSAGTYQGQSGFALGLSHATENRAWIVKGSATVDTRGNFGGNVGAGYQF